MNNSRKRDLKKEDDDFIISPMEEDKSEVVEPAPSWVVKASKKPGVKQRPKNLNKQ